MTVFGDASTGTPFDWRQEGPEASKRAWFRYLYFHADQSSPETERAFDAGFLKGAQWAMRATSALSPAVAAMVAFVDWIHEHDLEVGE
jgi:hypothetical protein